MEQKVEEKERVEGRVPRGTSKDILQLQLDNDEKPSVSRFVTEAVLEKLDKTRG